MASNSNPSQATPHDTHSEDMARSSASARRWMRRLIVMGAVLAVFLATLVPKIAKPKKKQPKLTFTVERGDVVVSVLEQGIVESAENTEIKCKVRGQNTVLWVVESGTIVKPGDILVRLDTLFIEEQINERSKYAHWSRSGAESSKGRLAAAKLAVKEYEEGQFVAEKLRQEKDLAIANSRLRTAQSMFEHAKMMAERGYVSDQDVEDREFAVTQAKLTVDLKETQLELLQKYTKPEMLQTLKGSTTAIGAVHEANVERAGADASRRDRAVGELKHCIVRAARGGMVIHPSAALWRNAPEIAEGTRVHQNQVLLLMPDLTKMQVKIGVNESVVDRIKKGQFATVNLPDEVLDGKVKSVASVTKPGGWWNGNAVDYDTVINIPSTPRLRPGMSAEVEILIAEYKDVLRIPVAALLQIGDRNFCWVKTKDGSRHREVILGDSNDVFTVVKSGLVEGEQVLLNPLDNTEAQALIDAVTERMKKEAEKTGKASSKAKGKPGKPGAKGGKPKVKSGKPKVKSGKPTGKPKPAKPAGSSNKPTSAKPAKE